jgi:hypothetical protein
LWGEINDWRYIYAKTAITIWENAQQHKKIQLNYTGQKIESERSSFRFNLLDNPFDQ